MLSAVRTILLTPQVQPSFIARLVTNLFASANGSATPTFTRATTAYQEDFEGKRNLALSGEARFQGARRVRNLATSTEAWATIANTQLAGADAWGNGTTYTTVTGQTDPLGGTAAVKITYVSGNNPVYYRSSILRNRVYRWSIWLRADSGTYNIRISATDTTTWATAFVTGTLALDTTWRRYSLLVDGVTAAWAASANVDFNLGYEGKTPFNPTVGTFYAAFPIIEDVTGQANQNPSEYVSKGVLSAPYHGANVDGVKYFNTLNGNTVASNVVTEATGAAIVAGAAGVAATAPVDAYGPLGVIGEPSQQNVLGTTAAIVRTMSDAGWVASNITKGTATGANGVASAAASLTATAGNGTVLYTTVLGAAVRSYVPLVRRKTGTGVVNITVDNGVTWTPMTLTAVYQPIQEVTASAANPIIGFRIVTSGDAIEVDFNNLVAGAVAPAMPVPVNVTTAASVDQYVSAGNLPASNNDFAIYGESAFPIVPPAGDYYFWGSYVDADNYTAVLWDGTNLIARRRIGATSHDATIALSPTAGTIFKWAARFTSTMGTDIFVSGVQGTNDATNTACQIGTNFQINGDGNGAGQPYAVTRNFTILPKAVSSAKLQIYTLPGPAPF